MGEQGHEDLHLFFEAKKGSARKTFWETLFYTLQEEGTTFRQNMTNRSPSKASQYPRKMEYYQPLSFIINHKVHTFYSGSYFTKTLFENSPASVNPPETPVTSINKFVFVVGSCQTARETTVVSVLRKQISITWKRRNVFW